MTAQRPISLCALTALELAPPDLVSAAAAAGYTHVGLRLVAASPTEPQREMVGDTPMVRETRARLDATGLQALDIEVLRLRPETLVARDLLPAIETGAWLGAKHALVVGNDPVESRLADRYAELCDLAARYGVSPELEFMSFSDVKSLAQAERVVERAGRANAGIVVDAYHVSRTGCRLSDIARIPPSRFRYLQLCDAPAAIPPTVEATLAEARAERRFPGEGELDLVSLVRAMPPDIPVALEVPTLGLAKTVGAVERARRAIAGARRVLAAAEPGRASVRAGQETM